ncbi:MAG: MATE family efflux transporter [Lachnospiraceae bacterium]|nr:MATE family efflux transporter [Lachnospiraceae bacterium]
MSLIGDKKFNKKVLWIALPIMIQNGITNFVGLLDNIMIGQVGTEEMSGVSIVNQFNFVFLLCMFGVVSGAGILGAQYYGQGNVDGVRKVMRIKLVISMTLMLIAGAVFILFDDTLISIFLKETDEALDLAATLAYGKEYLAIMLIGMPPLAIEMSYSSTLRESGQTKIPMLASIVAVFVNLLLNYILIFGKFGAPELGVAGAAIATVVSRYIQAALVVAYSHTHTKQNPYFEGLYKNFKLSGVLFKKVIVLAAPLMANETLWAAGMTAINSCYAQRGLSVVAATNIQSTLYNIFNIMFIAMGDSLAIVVGQLLGAGEIEEAKDSSKKIIVMSMICASIGGILMIAMSFWFPNVYNTTDEVKDIAATLIRICAYFMPIHGFLHAVYFAIRSGGKTFVTFMFDSGYTWLIVFPVAYVLSHFTGLNIAILYLCCQAVDIIKVTVGFFIYRSGIWAKNITI